MIRALENMTREKKLEIPVVAQPREGKAESGYVQNLNGTCKEERVNSSPCPLCWHKKNRLIATGISKDREQG